MLEESADSTRSERIWNPAFIRAFMINVLAYFSIYLVNTLSGLYADFLGAEITVVGVVSSLFALTALIFKVIAAPAIDSCSRHRILVGSMIILFTAYLCYFLADNVPLLIVSRLITGAGLAFVAPCCISIASDSLPVDKMLTGLGVFSLGTAICQAFAPALGLWLKDTVGYKYSFAILAGMTLLATVYILTIKSNEITSKRYEIRLSSIFAKEALIPSVIILFLSMSASAVTAFLVLYGNLVLFGHEQVNHSPIGLFFTVYSVILLLSRPLIGKLADRFGLVKVVIPSILCFAASLLMISLSKTFAVLMIAAILLACGFGASQPILTAACMKGVNRERYGAASCTSYIGMDIGYLIGPLVAGFVAESISPDKTTGYSAMWQIMILPIAAAMVISIIFSRQLMLIKTR